MKQHFEGYYFKCEIGEKTIAFIPAMHGSGVYGTDLQSDAVRRNAVKTGREQSGASLQIITNDSAYLIPYNNIAFSRHGLKLKIGNSCFSESGLCIDIYEKDCDIHGKLRFGRLHRLKYDIMGPFRYVPHMQCRHMVVSMQHSIRGWLSINGKVYHAVNGIGYIEGDSGFSFPKNYLWTQCHFDKGSIMLSVAEIPLCGFCFRGIIGIVIINGKEYRIATYLGARVEKLGSHMLAVRQGKYILSVKLLEADAKELQAPIMGQMTRTIQESVRCKAWYRFMSGNRILTEFIGENASFEYMY